MKSNEHQFAFFVPALSETVHQVSDNQIKITDADLIHRWLHVVRMHAGDTCILFDKKIHVSAQFVSLDKKHCVLAISNRAQNAALVPDIQFLLPLLKRDDLESAIYALVETGITDIRLVITKKTPHSLTQKELLRAQKIVIAAAQQSKNFLAAHVHEPEHLQTVLEKLPDDSRRIFADPHGISLKETMQSLTPQNVKKIVLMVGPEGDLTDTEKLLLRDHAFQSTRLTPTILRAFQAAGILAGSIRSYLDEKSKN